MMFCFKVFFLIKIIITTVSLDRDTYKPITDTYDTERPDKILDLKLSSLKWKWFEFDEKFRSNKWESWLKMCNGDNYLKLPLLLKVATTLPVTSCEWEERFSVLRHQSTWLRTSTTITVKSILTNVQWKYFLNYINV